MKKNRVKIITTAVILVVLGVVFWWGGNAPGSRGWAPQSESQVAALPSSTASPEVTPEVKLETTQEVKPTEKPSVQASAHPTVKQKKNVESRPGGAEGAKSAGEKVEMAAAMSDNSSDGVEKGNAKYSQLQGMKIDQSTGADQYLTEPVPEGKPVPVEPQNAVITDKAYTCTLSVRCNTILNNMSWLDPEKVELVPKDGIFFPPTKVTFYEGESVFNVLVREMKKNKIHLEFDNTPIFNSAYIEGIHNLYEYDCGDLSGWMYKVNDWFPNYGCSRYQLQDGDVVQWVYTCDLGVDVGGYYAPAGD